MTRGDAYSSESGDEIYLRVSDYTFNEARHEAADHAYQIGDAWSRTRYHGKQMIALHDHDDWEECEDCDPEQCWVFEHYEGSYRH